MEKLGLAEGIFAGRVALVTGSARGIGEATARALAFLGAKIIIVDRRVEQGRAVATSIQKAGGQARFLRCDLSKVGEISRYQRQRADANLVSHWRPLRAPDALLKTFV